MNREQLFIGNQYIPLSKSINASITKSITDIESPDKRKATYSKSARVPNSKEAQQVFGDLFELNLTDSSFDPTVKIDVLYKVDGEIIINGYCQLKNIIQVDRWEIEYEIVMFSDLANIFQDMGEEYLRDLYSFSDTTNQLSRWDHSFTREIQQLSWETSVFDQTTGSLQPFELGKGYVYPLIDFGYSTDNLNYDFTEIGCALYVKEYIDAIFAKHGYTYTSNFFDSTYFKSLIIPSSPRVFVLDESDILNREFKADTPNYASGGTTSGNVSKFGFGTPEIIEFTNEISDAGNNYNPSTGVFTAVNAGLYDFSSYVDLTATFTPSGGSVVTTSGIEGRVEIFVNGVATASEPFYITFDDYPSTFSAGARSTNSSPAIPQVDTEYLTNSSDFWWDVSSLGAYNGIGRVQNPPNRYYVVLNNVYLDAGDTVDVRWKAEYRGFNDQVNQMFYNGVSFIGGDATVTLEGGEFFNKLLNFNLITGQTLTMNKVIPDNVKQKDFFMSIVKMFNLWIDVDPLNNDNLLIEPREDFLSSDIVDISGLLAQDRDLKITPMGKLDAVDYEFTYKPDKDYYNEKYEGDWQKVYGNREVDSTNEFTTKQKKIDVIFSPTPLAAQPNSDRVMSTIIELDDLNYPKDVDFNIRILYYGGLISAFDTWQHTEQITSWPYLTIATAYGSYPYAGHFDNPYNATEDINWGLVDEVYYDDNIQTITITNNNLVNKYYLDQLSAYTSKNSRIVEGFFNLQPQDFRNWTFDKLYYFERSYFRLQKISGYNPTGEELTKCQFLLLEEVPKFTPDEDDVVGGQDPIGGFDPDTGGAIDPSETLPGKGTKNSYNVDGNNTSGRGAKIQGTGNYVSPRAYQVEIQGDGNQVYNEARFIKIQGDNNTIDAGVKNVTLINTSNLKIEESNVTYINGVKVDSGSISNPSSVEEISASQDVDVDVKAYVVDTSGGDVTVTFQLAGVTYTEGQIWYFKKDSSANDLIVQVAGGTIDGSTTKVIKNLNSAAAVIYDGGTEFYIV